MFIQGGALIFIFLVMVLLPPCFLNLQRMILLTILIINALMWAKEIAT